LSRILSGQLAEANKRANALAAKLEQSEKARKKAEADAAAVEDLRKRLHDAETSLSENISQQSVRETEILSRLESQCRRFVSKCQNPCIFPRVTSHSPRGLYL
jgi:predicted  nucleic acid-binding Zn-ribbon protein